MTRNKLEQKIADLENEINAIKDRNKRVEGDKSWETSLFRILLISFLIYIISSFAFFELGVKAFLLSALVPTAGYFLSTQSLPIIKKWWLESRNK